MDRKLIYVFSLAGFFLMWGLFGFVAAGPRSAPVVEASHPPVADSPANPDLTTVQGIPVTGNRPDPSGMPVLFWLLGLGAVLLILALLNRFNKPTATSVRDKRPPDEL